jgi:hypothetical protein
MSAEPPPDPPPKAAAPKTASWKTPLATAAPTDEVARTPAPPPALKSSSNAATAAKRKQQTSPATPAPSGPPKTPSHDVNGGPMTLTELAVPLRSRIWDLTDGRLVNGEWTRYDWKPNSDLKILEPFGGTVAEFETAMRTELDLPEREAPGVQFIKMIAEHEKYRDAHRKATKSAPVVGLFGGSLVGVTAPMWEVADSEGDLRREFSTSEDAEMYVKRNVEIKVTKVKNIIRAADAFSSSIKEEAGGGRELREGLRAAQAAAAKEAAEEAAAIGGGGGSSSSSIPMPSTRTQVRWTMKATFDCEAAIATAASRSDAHPDQIPELEARLRKIVRGDVDSELAPRKKRLRTQVQDAIQVFAQVIEDEDGICVCDFKKALITEPIGPQPAPGVAETLEEEYERKRAAFFDEKIMNFQTLRDEPVIMLGQALRRMRPLRPRVIIVCERSTMEATLRKLREEAMRGGRGLRHLYPAMGWVVVPNGTNIPHAKANLMIALARVLHRHSLAVACSGSVGVLQQMNQAALWDVPMMVLHGSGGLSDIWMKMWPRRLVEGFEANKVHEALQSCAGYRVDMESAHQVREVLKKGTMMLHSIDANSNAFERLFRIELNGDQLIETALKRLSSYGLTIKVYAKYKKPIATLAIYVGLAATLASVFVSNLEVFGSESNQNYSGDTFRWIAVIAPAILVILNSVENFVNLNSMLVIAERAKAKVESLLYIYRLRALQFSDNFIDQERDKRAKMQRLALAMKAKDPTKAMSTRKKKFQTGGLSDSDSEMDDEDAGQESGDIITLRQAKLAEFLESINKDFSESGAVLLELAKIGGLGPTTKKQQKKQEKDALLGNATKQSLKHRRRVPSKSRAQKQTKPIVPEPSLADDSDDDLNPNMLSPLSMLESMTGPMVRDLEQAQADAIRASGLRDFRGGEYGGDVVSIPGQRFSRDAQTVLDVEGRRVDVPGVGIRTEGGAGVAVPDTRARLPSSGEITGEITDAATAGMTDEERHAMEYYLRRAGVDPSNVPGLPRFDGRQIGAAGGEYAIPPVNYDLLSPRSFETPGGRVAIPGYDFGFGGTEFATPKFRVPDGDEMADYVDARGRRVVAASAAAALRRAPKTPSSTRAKQLMARGKVAQEKADEAKGVFGLFFPPPKKRTHREENAAAKEELKEFEESAWSTSTREYVRFRLSLKLKEFRLMHNLLFKWSLLMQMVMYILSATGSVLATIGQPQWVAITVAVGQAAQQWLRQNRIEERRIAYRQASAELADAKMKWEAVPMEKRAMQSKIDDLVRRVETAIVSVVEPLPTQVNCPSLEVLIERTESGSGSGSGSGERERKGGGKDVDF